MPYSPDPDKEPRPPIVVVAVMLGVGLACLVIAAAPLIVRTVLALMA